MKLTCPKQLQSQVIKKYEETTKTVFDFESFVLYLQENFFSDVPQARAFKRAFGFDKRSGTSRRTLDILCKYAGYSSGWDGYKESQQLAKAHIDFTNVLYHIKLLGFYDNDACTTYSSSLGSNITLYNITQQCIMYQSKTPIEQSAILLPNKGVLESVDVLQPFYMPPYYYYAPTSQESYFLYHRFNQVVNQHSLLATYYNLFVDKEEILYHFEHSIQNLRFVIDLSTIQDYALLFSKFKLTFHKGGEGGVNLPFILIGAGKWAYEIENVEKGDHLRLVYAK